jgi:hypothetical protein
MLFGVAQKIARGVRRRRKLAYPANAFGSVDRSDLYASGSVRHLEISMKSFLWLAVSAMVVCPIPCAADEFALRDGDTVVFLGDSITAARTYGRIIENYTLLRFPERKVRFLNMGHGGETAAGAATRLDQAVFQTGATVVTVAYGVNDTWRQSHAHETSSGAHSADRVDGAHCRSGGKCRSVAAECGRHRL